MGSGNVINCVLRIQGEKFISLDWLTSICRAILRIRSSDTQLKSMGCWAISPRCWLKNWTETVVTDLIPKKCELIKMEVTFATSVYIHTQLTLNRDKMTRVEGPSLTQMRPFLGWIFCGDHPFEKPWECRDITLYVELYRRERWSCTWRV